MVDIGMRVVTLALLCLAFIVVQVFNSNMPIVVVCMQEHRKLNQSSYFYQQLPQKEWSPQQIAWVYSAFSVGRLFMLVAGWCSDRLNAKWLIAGTTLTAVALTAAIPSLAHFDVLAVIGARFCLGVAEGFTTPAINGLLTRWIHDAMRSVALAIVSAGRQLGILIMLPLAGTLCDTDRLGWPSIFYASAMAGTVFLLFWVLLGADKPSHSACISKGELKAIEQNMISQQALSVKRSQRTVPWKSLLSSSAVWASVLAVACHELPLMSVITFMPSYLADRCGITCSMNAVYSAIPFGCLLLAKLLSSILISRIQHYCQLSMTISARLSNAFASVGLSLSMIAFGLVPCETTMLKIGFMALAVAFSGFHTSGCLTTLTTIAPMHTGTVTGLCFFVVSIVGIAHPLVVEAYVGKIVDRWDHVYFASAIVAILPVAFYSIWGDATEQSWAKPNSQKNSTSSVAPVKIRNLSGVASQKELVLAIEL